MNKNLLNGLKFIGLVITTLGTLFALNISIVNASTKDVHIKHAERISLKNQAKGYVYANKALSKVKSKNIKTNFGKHSLLSTKKFIIVNKHGKKNVYAYVNDIKAPKKSGWIAVKSLNVKLPKVLNKKYSKNDHGFTKNDINEFEKQSENQFKKMDRHGQSANASHSNYSANQDLSDSQIKSQIESKVIKFVNEQRAQNGKSPLVESPGLMKVAQERASYLDASQGDDNHYITQNGQKHSQEAAYLDGKSMGIVNDDNLYESNSVYGGDSNFTSDDLDGALVSFESMITADSDPYNGHMKQLLGDYNGQIPYYGFGIRIDRNSDGVNVTIEILQSNTNY